jgi:hypothetical protein
VSGSEPVEEDAVPRYLISFPEGAMTFPDEDLPAVAGAAHAVVREAKAAGVWVFGGGLLAHGEATKVDADGSVSNGPYPGTSSFVAGFSIIDVPTRDEAEGWAARIAAACRCAQEVREIMYDPES